MNKKSFHFLLTCMVILIIISSACKKRESVNEIEQFQNSLTAADTTDILTISNKFMQTMQSGNVNEAISSLIMLDSAKNIKPLPENVVNGIKGNFRLFPVISYKIQSFEFQKADSNYVAFTYVAIPATETEPEVTMGFRTKPVKIDGKWYLTLPGLIQTSPVAITDSI